MKLYVFSFRSVMAAMLAILVVFSPYYSFIQAMSRQQSTSSRAQTEGGLSPKLEQEILSISLTQAELMSNYAHYFLQANRAALKATPRADFKR